MLADLMLQKNEWEAAIYHFQQLLETTPAHFKARARARARDRGRVRVRVDHPNPNPNPP